MPVPGWVCGGGQRVHFARVLSQGQSDGRHAERQHTPQLGFQVDMLLHLLPLPLFFLSVSLSLSFSLPSPSSLSPVSYTHLTLLTKTLV